MAYIRALRLNQGLTLSELALMSGVPARLLAQIEHGLEPLDPHSRARLAAIFNVAPPLLSARAVAAPPPESGARLLPQAAVVAAFGLAAALTLAQPLPLALPRAAALPHTSPTVASAVARAADAGQLFGGNHFISLKSNVA